MPTMITPSRYQDLRRQFPPPTLIDARTAAAFDRDPAIIPGAVRGSRDAIADGTLVVEPWRPAVVYCVHGHEVSQQVATSLCDIGIDAHPLEGGIEGWRAGGGETVPFAAPSHWVTRARPKIDRIACPWLIRRFIDPAAEIHYVPAGEVRAFAAQRGATPFDIPDVAYSHAGEACSFDAFIRRHALHDPALERLAAIVRGADTDALGLTPQSAGLLAVSLGMSRIFTDDLTMLRFGMLVYDALYAWCQGATAETHGWDPAALSRAARG